MPGKIGVMCGIAGFVDFEGHRQDVARYRIKEMADALIHRGPDEGGVFVDDFAALGHRRLSIIDLNSGQQPLGSRENQVQIVFNGEIYNFIEMRTELEAKGYRFRTDSDTEVILVGYIEWGESCVERLNGMFAFAIWDARVKKLVLARDRVGKKPLYYFRGGSIIAFASELKALRAGGLCANELDLESLDCYFSFGFIPAPKTIYKEVRKLRAAHCMLVSEKKITEAPYWSVKFGDPTRRSLDQVVDEFEALLDKAVGCRLMSEVPLGAFLSGGLDSALVVSSMARLLDRPVITNSIGFEDSQFNELPMAGIIARHLKTDHHEFVVGPKVAEVVDKIAWHFDEPLADPSAVPTWYVCQMARKTVTVALSGDGGDEGFGGYTFRYQPHVAEARLRAVLPTALRRCVFGVLGAFWPASAKLPRPVRLKTIFENLAVGDAEAFYRDLIWLRGDVRKELYSPDFLAELKGFTPMEAVYPFYAYSDAQDALSRSQDTDIHFYMTDDVLVKVDRMSMAHSLEVRCPLLDHRILEFAATLSADLKVNTRRGKLPLHGLARRRLPSETLKNRKKGFSIPLARWLRGELRPLAESLIFDKDRFFFDLFNEDTIRRLWAEHLNMNRDHSAFFWGLLMVSAWERKFHGKCDLGGLS
jgi:asparagine synthase (glutamine-hydrolysing)